MDYLSQSLIFESDKIYYYDEDYGGNLEVMMSWEDKIMSASAAYVCQNRGDILEIGDQETSTALSVNAKAGMGDYYIMDIFSPILGAGNADQLAIRSDTQVYWHEK